MTTTPPADDTTTPTPIPVPPSGRYSTKAVVGLILAAVSVLFLLAPVLNWVTAVPAVILCHLALREITTTAERGREVAIAGLVIGYLTIGLTLLLLITAAGVSSVNTPPGQDHDACFTRTEPTDKQVQQCVDSYNQ